MGEFICEYFGVLSVLVFLPPCSVEKACLDGEDPRTCFPRASVMLRTCVRELALQEQGGLLVTFSQSVAYLASRRPSDVQFLLSSACPMKDKSIYGKSPNLLVHRSHRVGVDLCISRLLVVLEKNTNAYALPLIC